MRKRFKLAGRLGRAARSPGILVVCLVAGMLPAGAGPRVCIDPGHPSEVSSGAGIQHGTSEVHVNWRVALKLQKLLEARGVAVTLTKSRERQWVCNAERARIANCAGADLMIRLHCDSGRGRGYALYYPDRPGRTQGVTGPPRAVIAESRRAAQAVHAGMREVLGDRLRDGGVRTDRATRVGSRQGALTGSIHARVPVVTVEMLFLSSAGDAAFIRSEAGRQRMAEALCEGIVRFLDTREDESLGPTDHSREGTPRGGPNIPENWHLTHPSPGNIGPDAPR